MFPMVEQKDRYWRDKARISLAVLGLDSLVSRGLMNNKGCIDGISELLLLGGRSLHV